ncbi:MAG: hypothetical protein ACPGWR_16090 [Ardenticatenaceae bacterium]
MSFFDQPEKVTHLSSEVGYLSSEVGHPEDGPQPAGGGLSGVRFVPFGLFCYHGSLSSIHHLPPVRITML